MKKSITSSLYVVAVFVFVCLPFTTQAVSVTEDVVDCKFSWACFKRAAQTCTPAKVKKSTPSIELFGLKTTALVTLEIQGKDIDNQCIFTQTPYKFKYTPTVAYIDAIMKQDSVSAYTVRREVKEMEKMANTPELYEMATYNCTGKTEDVATFFKYFVREYKNAEATSSVSISNSSESIATMSFLDKKVQCSNT